MKTNFLLIDIETTYLSKPSDIVKKTIQKRYEKIKDSTPRREGNYTFSDSEIETMRKQSCLLNPWLSKLGAVNIGEGSLFTNGGVGFDNMECIVLPTEKGILGATKIYLEDYIKKNEENQLYVTFNGIDFDAWYLLQKFIQYDMNSKFDIGLFNFTRYKARPHFDMMQWLVQWNSRNYTSLEVIASQFGIDTKDKNKERDNLQLYLEEGEYSKVEKYGLIDLEIHLKLFQKIAKYYL